MSEVEVVNGQGQPVRLEPLHEQLWIGVRAKQQVPWCGELAGDDQLRHRGFGGDLHPGHGGFLPVGSIA
jgi:hypothetical protein